MLLQVLEIGCLAGTLSDFQHDCGFSRSTDPLNCCDSGDVADDVDAGAGAAGEIVAGWTGCHLCCCGGCHHVAHSRHPVLVGCCCCSGDAVVAAAGDPVAAVAGSAEVAVAGAEQWRRALCGRLAASNGSLRYLGVPTRTAGPRAKTRASRTGGLQGCGRSTTLAAAAGSVLSAKRAPPSTGPGCAGLGTAHIPGRRGREKRARVR